ncbi:MAG: hypothetical protein H0V66_04325, partial [Bdellovibrionales bacterium]|nr:hypothetical protein [Bdellovibrionales bacterium]
SQMGDNCLSKVVWRTNSKVVSNFACMDGLKGVTTWFIKSTHKYVGVTKLITPWGEQSEIIYKANFFSPVCVKPKRDKVVI